MLLLSTAPPGARGSSTTSQEWIATVAHDTVTRVNGKPTQTRGTRPKHRGCPPATAPPTTKVASLCGGMGERESACDNG